MRIAMYTRTKKERHRRPYTKLHNKALQRRPRSEFLISIGASFAAPLNAGVIRLYELLLMTNAKIEVQCRYLRTTSLFTARAPLLLPNSTSIRFFDGFEAAKFSNTMQRSNPKARLSGTRNFYV